VRRPSILLILTEFPPRIGGMQAHAMSLARHLYKRGYPVEVLTYRPNRHEEKYAVQTHDFRLPFPVHRILSRLGYWHNIELIVNFARQFRPDLIYCSTVFYGFLSEHLDVPVICRSVGNDVMRPWIVYPFRFASRLVSSPFFERSLYDLFKRFNYPEWIEILFHKVRYQLMVRSARLMSYVMANSKYTAELLAEIGLPAQRIGMVVGGVDARLFACRASVRDRQRLRTNLGLPPGRFLIMTACRLVAKKGIDTLVNAFLELRDRMPDAHLVIIGEGRHEKRYRRLVKRLNLNEYVTFTGRVPHSDIQPYYWATDLFVLASRVQVNPVTGLRDAETMGRVLCEANAAGIPVVAASSGGIPSVVAHKRNGLLFEADNVPDLVRQVVKIRTDEVLRKRLVKTGLKWSRERFDWSVIMAEHEKIIDRVLGIKSKRSPRKKKKKSKKRRKPALARSGF